MNKTNFNQRGFLAITAVLILGAIFLIVTIAGFSGSVSEMNIISLNLSSLRADNLTASCTEELIEKAKSDPEFKEGEISLEFDKGICSGEMINLGVFGRTVLSKGESGDFIKKTRTNISELFPEVIINSQYRYYEDYFIKAEYEEKWDLNFQLENVERYNNNLVLKKNQEISEDFEENNIFDLGDLSTSRENNSAKTGSYGLLVQGGANYHQKVYSEIFFLSNNFSIQGWVRPESGGSHSASLSGFSFGVPELIGDEGYQVILDVSDGSGSTANFQIRKDFITVLGSENPEVNEGSWYFIKAERKDNGDIIGRLYNENMDLLSSISVNDHTYTQGYIGISSFDRASFDDISIVINDYIQEGYRISNPISLDNIKKVTSSNIKWEETLPIDTSIEISVGLNEDNETEPVEYTIVEENDVLIPVIEANNDLTGKYLWIKQELETENTEETPILKGLKIEILGRISS